VRGEVQGVGYRDATQQWARRHEVMGWVRNGEDGSVLVHAEGPGAAVEDLVAFLNEGGPAARVAEALDRGHAVFVLRGEKLRGGFALQRTRAGEKAQWLLIKRRDEEARPGSDVVAERPQSVTSGSTLDELLH
jgi:acylphosphatase